MPPPKVVLDLIEKFDRHRESYESAAYNETQMRREFLDPLLEALGWDVQNKGGVAEAYKDVIHEDAIKIGGLTKAPDYCLRIGGTRKCFVEAKKPAHKLKNDAEAAFQLRRYAWSAKLPLSILTDFQEFAVYDCRLKPSPKDKASAGRVMYITHDQYPDKWDEIAGVFSREAILRGEFDKFAQAKKPRRGTATVDEAFLKEIEGWRESLAKNIAVRNRRLEVWQINFAVQRIIDRVIFLRICEDRGIESYGRLQALQNGKNAYARLVELFDQADGRYNSGLFHFREEKGRVEAPDELTPVLKIDDDIVRSIVEDLYYPKSPYEFSVLPADILGQVYEQFLEKVIRLTVGHHVRVEEKPEIRKAGGVYYTPTHIVEHIVRQTVGRLLEGRTPRQAADLKVLDPACGSGSFLIGAYQLVLDWHRDSYVNDGPEKHRKVLYQGMGGEWRLTTKERTRILLNNIYGVDIDPQAVEVTKLSLLLKVLEGGSPDVLQREFWAAHERVLPDLGKNVKCGNSLIETDVIRDQVELLENAEERRRLNAFDWQQEFKDVFGPGKQGFDAVIGNPPYGSPLSAEEVTYLTERHKQTAGFPDTYCLFMARAHELTRKGGMFSYVVPNTFCDLENAQSFREWLLRDLTLQELWQTGWAFKAAIVDTVVFTAARQKPAADARVTILVDGRRYTRRISEFLGNDLLKIDYRNSDEERRLLHQVLDLKTVSPLSTFATVRAGVKMYEKGKGSPAQTERTLSERPFSTQGKQPKGWKPLYRGEDVFRYRLAEPNEFVKYGEWLAAPRTPDLFESPKILMRRTDDRLFACLEE